MQNEILQAPIIKSKKQLQLYLNEFVYKLNLKYFGEKIFDRLVVTNTTGYE